MTQSRMTLALLAVFLVFSVTRVAGSHEVDKSRVRPAGAVVYKGAAPPVMANGMVEASCGDCCGDCGSCAVCCPRLLPMLLGGIDCLLKKLFCCGACCDPCCGAAGSAAIGYASPGCGCESGCDSRVISPSAPNPFRDDPVEPAVVPQSARHYQLWNVPQHAGYQTNRKGTPRVAVSANGAPRTLSVPKAEPLKNAQTSSVRVATPAKAQNVRATSGDANEDKVPHNPLRD